MALLLQPILWNGANKATPSRDVEMLRSSMLLRHLLVRYKLHKSLEHTSLLAV